MEVCKRILEGEDNLWEVKNLGEMKLEVWNQVVEKANSDFEGYRKEFCAFVGRRTKGEKRGITALRNRAGVSVTCKRHYQQLGTCSVDGFFNDSWKVEVDKKVSEFSELPTDCVENV